MTHSKTISSPNSGEFRSGALFRWLLFSPFLILIMSLVSLMLVLFSVSHKTNLVQVMHDQAMLNQINYEFKIQVQEWKNFLIRSHIEGAHEYYWARFTQQEEEVSELVHEFQKKIESPQILATLKKFARQHQKMSREYHAARDAFVKESLDLSVGDSQVAGIDRQPSDTINHTIEMAEALVNGTLNKSQRISGTTVAISIGVLLTTGLWIGGFACAGVHRLMHREDQQQKQLMEIACTDSVTRVHNRFSLEQRCNQLFAERQRDLKPIQFIYMDLDGLKGINDHYGHDVGDKLLRAFAEKLLSAVSEDDFVARIGGDEFVILRVNPVIGEASSEFIDCLESQVCGDYDLGTVTVSGGASIGDSFFPTQGRTLRGLIRHADERMYAVKQKKRSVCETSLALDSVS